MKLELHKFYILATHKWHLESIIMETENKSYGKTKTNKTKRHIIYSKNVSYIQQKYKPYSAREYNPR